LKAPLNSQKQGIRPLVIAVLNTKGKDRRPEY